MVQSKSKSYDLELALSDTLQTLESARQVTSTSGGQPTGRGILRTDSRKVQSGDIFIAYKGVSSDGHAHIAAAVKGGAALLVVEEAQRVPSGCITPWISVKSGRAAWSYLAAKAAGSPQDALRLVGVTGTNGKTSTVWMTGQLLAAIGVPCLTIGTLGAYMNGEHIPTGHTTPDPDLLFGLMADARTRGINVCTMEVSSHAIAQEKVLPLRFDACAFTSFSRDHLDFHPTLDDYFETKAKLFTHLARPEARMAFWQGLEPRFAAELGSADIFVYGHSPLDVVARWQARPLEIGVTTMDFKGTTLSLTLGASGERFTGKVPYFASHALENFAAAFLLASKIAGRYIPASYWERLAPVPGRLEQVQGFHPVPVVVDYAHTPDALEKTLQVLRPFCKGRLIVVFGCGGDRDSGKRPLMGRIAESLADQVHLTSDNPRSEEPAYILHEILGGMAKPEAARVNADRAQAIACAIRDATSEDLVLLAGKGHETYQILSTGTIEFDDCAVARGILNERR